jgi:hypothetical protein
VNRVGDFQAEIEGAIAKLIAEVLDAARQASLAELAETARLNQAHAAAQHADLHENGIAQGAQPSARARQTSGHRLRRLRTLQRAIEWQIQLETGQIGSRAQIAKREGISRAAVTQSMRSLGGLAIDVSDRPAQPAGAVGAASVRSLRGYRELRRELLQRFDADYVSKVLRATSNNVSLAARLAKIDRKHLWRLMRRTGGQSARSSKRGG